MTHELPTLTTAEQAAARIVRVHCAVDWPEGVRCNNCRLPHPCPTYHLAVAVLLSEGWSWGRIEALDVRRGVWA